MSIAPARSSARVEPAQVGDLVHKTIETLIEERDHYRDQVIGLLSEEEIKGVPSYQLFTTIYGERALNGGKAPAAAKKAPEPLELPNPFGPRNNKRPARTVAGPKEPKALTLKPKAKPGLTSKPRLTSKPGLTSRPKASSVKLVPKQPLDKLVHNNQTYLIYQQQIYDDKGMWVGEIKNDVLMISNRPVLVPNSELLFFAEDDGDKFYQSQDGKAYTLIEDTSLARQVGRLDGDALEIFG